MSTSYYLHTNCCKFCQRSDKVLIGKSNAGWVFKLNLVEGFAESLDEWKKLFKKGKIFSEYGYVETEKTMLEIITSTWFQWPETGFFGIHTKRELPKRSAEWYILNKAEPGPNGLARCKADGSFCVYHGDTWDMCRLDR
jgi:hypothetical protein